MSLPPVASPALRDDRAPRPAVSGATIALRHLRIEAASDLETVKAALESLVSPVDPAVARYLRAGDRDRVALQETRGARLSIVVVRDHGSFLAIASRVRKAYGQASTRRCLSCSMRTTGAARCSRMTSRPRSSASSALTRSPPSRARWMRS
jgi:hypothetical protein